MVQWLGPCTLDAKVLDLIKVLDPMCTQDSACNFWGFPATQDVLAVFPISPHAKFLWGKGSPTEQGMADAQVLAGWDLRKERGSTPKKPRRLSAEQSGGRKESEAVSS